MCSCSGNCNCNSSTIPRGPQGPQGPAATIAVGQVTSLPSGDTPTVTNSGTSGAATFDFGIPAGTPGSNGAPGINGKNAYTLTADFYTQPNFGDIAVFDVSDTSWMSVNQIIFVGNPTGTSNIGGYYKVTSISPPFGFEAIRLDWSIPGVTYTSVGNDIPPGAIIQASGTIGASAQGVIETLYYNPSTIIGVDLPNNITQYTPYTIPAGTLNYTLYPNQWIEVTYDLYIYFVNGPTGFTAYSRNCILSLRDEITLNTQSVSTLGSSLYMGFKMYLTNKIIIRPQSSTSPLGITYEVYENRTFNLSNSNNVRRFKDGPLLSPGNTGDAYLVADTSDGTNPSLFSPTINGGAPYSWDNVNNSWNDFTSINSLANRGLNLNEVNVISGTGPIDISNPIGLRFAVNARNETNTIIIKNFTVKKFTT